MGTLAVGSICASCRPAPGMSSACPRAPLRPVRTWPWFPGSVTRDENTTIGDAAVLRALAHPARLALLEHLSQRVEGATATECAAVVGLSPSATSYHLRALAKVGMIREAPGRGDGRERIWQS